MIKNKEEKDKNKPENIPHPQKIDEQPTNLTKNNPQQPYLD